MGIMILKIIKCSEINLKVYRNHFNNRFAIEVAHKKGSGSTKNGRDSVSKRRGIKIYGRQPARAGAIIVQQVGSTIHPGNNVGCGKDYTLFALSEGLVQYDYIKGRKCVSVYTPEDLKQE